MGLLVADLMETEVTGIEEFRSIRQAAKRLLSADIGSLIVYSEDEVPVGIVSDTDVLQAVVDADRPLAETPVTEYMSHPLLMIEESTPVRDAVRRMNEEGVEQLVIIEEYDVIGIISQADITAEYEDLIHAAHAAEQKPPEY